MILFQAGNRMKRYTLLCLLLLPLAFGCKKLVNIPEPINTVTAPETFGTDALATSAINGIYSDMSYFGGNGLGIANGATTVYAGQCADELATFGYVSTYQSNTILITDGSIGGQFWNPAFFDIYQANAAIDGLNASKTQTRRSKTNYWAKRSFCEPIVTSISLTCLGTFPFRLPVILTRINLQKECP